MENNDYLLMHQLEKRYWYWQVKRDLIHRVINRYGNPGTRDRKILDVGCGTGSVLESLAHKGDLYGVDTSAYALKLCNAKGNFKLKRMNAEKLSFPENFFDVIIMSDIIEHVDDDIKVIENCRRILKTGGILIITVPAHMYLWNYDDARLGHKRRYNKMMLKSLASGFNVEKISYIHFFTYPLAVLARFREFLSKRGNKSSVEMKIKQKLLKGDYSTILVNRLLRNFGIFENSLLAFASFPVGVGLTAVFRKR